MPTATVSRTVLDTLGARLRERRAMVPVLAQRADAEGVTTITQPQDMVPLLFPHTTYKSYPESILAKGRWDQMNRWLDSLSAYRVADVDVTGITDVDDWIEQLEAAGHLVSSSSGTSGKGSFLDKSRRDRRASLDDLVRCLRDIGLARDTRWHVIPVGPETGVSHHAAVRDMLMANYGRPDAIPVPAAAAPATRHHAYMSRLASMRRAMAEGTASPDDVVAFEVEAAERQRRTEGRLDYFATRLLAHRDEDVFFNATLPLLYRLCEILRGRGASPGDFTGANALTTGGGLKGIPLPDDYLDQIFRLLNIAPTRFLHYYSMQELNVRMPKCPRGRYHVPRELVLFVLDKDGESLAPVSDDQTVGRAAFFDLTVDGRWGGTISGDEVTADFGACPCGVEGPTIFDHITRYSDLPDGDKITCAGTMDAYVRGFIDA